MVFIQDHTIPVGRVDPFILGLDAPGALVPAEGILKRAETDQWPTCVGLFIRQAPGRDELPAFEIHMLFQVSLPGALHGRLKVSVCFFPLSAISCPTDSTPCCPR